MKIKKIENIIVHQIFEPVFESFCFFIASVPLLAQKEFQELMLNSPNRFGELQVHDKGIIKVDLKYVYDYLNKSICLERDGIKTRANFTNAMKTFGRIYAISLFNILESSKFNNRINKSELYQFLKHIRNGSSHGNVFIFKPKEKKKLLAKPITWKNKKIDSSLEGKEVFNSFITCFDLSLIINDLSLEINSLK